MSDELPAQIGPYRILAKLGQGGMGAVFRAAHETLDRPAAVKLLPADMAGNPEYVSRFLREARTIATLNHPHIVRVYDAGAFEGKYFIAMELIEGQSLHDYCIEKQQVDEKVAIRLLYQAALGLSVAHAKGLVHRDIKPENLLLDRELNLHIVDFGLVRESSSQTQLTVTGTCLGTPMYMSPEQADGVRVDTRSDIYSLGATFYRLVTGRPPFSSHTVVSLLFKHKFEAPLDPRQFQPGLSENLVQLLFTMLAKSPQHRPHDGEALVELVERLMRGEPIPPAPPFTQTLNATIVRPSAGIEAQGGTSAAGPADSRRTAALIGLGVAVVLLATVLWLGLRTDHRPPDPPAWLQLVEGARKFEATGELELALALYEQALKQNPGDEELARKVTALKDRKLGTIEDADYRKYMEAGDQAAARGECGPARANYSLAQRVKPDSQDVMSKLRKVSGQMALRDAEQARATGDRVTARQKYLEALEYCPEMNDEVRRRLSSLGL